MAVSSEKMMHPAFGVEYKLYGRNEASDPMTGALRLEWLLQDVYSYGSDSSIE